jgi:hypothetical protein
MYFKANNSISLTLLTQEVSHDLVAVGLALTHSADQGTKKYGTALAQERLNKAIKFWNGQHFLELHSVINHCHESWGAGSFTMLVDYLQPLIDLLSDYANNASDKTNRSMHKSLFSNPFKFLVKHFDYPISGTKADVSVGDGYSLLQEGDMILEGDEYFSSRNNKWKTTIFYGIRIGPKPKYRRKTPQPTTQTQICASCGNAKVFGYINVPKYNKDKLDLIKIENRYGVKVPNTSLICESCYKTIGLVEAFENVARRLAIKPPSSLGIEPKVDPNTKVVSFSYHKIGDKWSVCIIFETDKNPIEYVKGKDYLSQEIIMATSLPLIY